MQSLTKKLATNINQKHRNASLGNDLCNGIKVSWIVIFKKIKAVNDEAFSLWIHTQVMQLTC